MPLAVSAAGSAAADWPSEVADCSAGAGRSGSGGRDGAAGCEIAVGGTVTTGLESATPCVVADPAPVVARATPVPISATAGRPAAMVRHGSRVTRVIVWLLDIIVPPGGGVAGLNEHVKERLRAR